MDLPSSRPPHFAPVAVDCPTSRTYPPHLRTVSAPATAVLQQLYAALEELSFQAHTRTSTLQTHQRRLRKWFKKQAHQPVLTAATPPESRSRNRTPSTPSQTAADLLRLATGKANPEKKTEGRRISGGGVDGVGHRSENSGLKTGKLEREGENNDATDNEALQYGTSWNKKAYSKGPFVNAHHAKRKVKTEHESEDGSESSEIAARNGNIQKFHKSSLKGRGNSSKSKVKLERHLGASASTASLADDNQTVKIANQVPIQTFYSSIEPYFRLVTADDLKWLQQKGDELTPFLFPTLGKSYLETGTDANGHDEGDIQSNRSTPMPSKTIHRPSTGGSVTQRIMHSLVDDAVVPVSEFLEQRKDEAKLDGPDDTEAGRPDDGVGELSEKDEQVLFDGGDWQRATRELVDLETRLKEELRYLGLLEDDDFDTRDDGEVPCMLRQLQRELRAQIELNSRRKQILLEIAQEYMGQQEYTNVLDKLDRQAEIAYARQFDDSIKGVLLKKRKLPSMTVPYGKRPATPAEEASLAISRRRRFIAGVGKSNVPEKKLVAAQKSIYDPAWRKLPNVLIGTMENRSRPEEIGGERVL